MVYEMYNVQMLEHAIQFHFTERKKKEIELCEHLPER